MIAWAVKVAAGRLARASYGCTCGVMHVVLCTCGCARVILARANVGFAAGGGLEYLSDWHLWHVWHFGFLGFGEALRGGEGVEA